MPSWALAAAGAVRLFGLRRSAGWLVRPRSISLGWGRPRWFMVAHEVADSLAVATQARVVATLFGHAAGASARGSRGLGRSGKCRASEKTLFVHRAVQLCGVCRC